MSNRNYSLKVANAASSSTIYRAKTTYNVIPTYIENRPIVNYQTISTSSLNPSETLPAYRAQQHPNTSFKLVHRSQLVSNTTDTTTQTRSKHIINFIIFVPVIIIFVLMLIGTLSFIYRKMRQCQIQKDNLQSMLEIEVMTPNLQIGKVIDGRRVKKLSMPPPKQSKQVSNFAKIQAQFRQRWRSLGSLGSIDSTVRNNAGSSVNATNDNSKDVMIYVGFDSSRYVGKESGDDSIVMTTDKRQNEANVKVETTDGHQSEANMKIETTDGHQSEANMTVETTDGHQNEVNMKVETTDGHQSEANTTVETREMLKSAEFKARIIELSIDLRKNGLKLQESSLSETSVRDV
ncbi:8377_t:CDS:1 [Ambispora gerdemannii]|uniref:8377_t:CDS:1 n=1 Tax=Ambispora gerdemannii TaxID=144530 RepID=A0A9N9B236_9GLOM|nr:8377_t:CDS:1 [Ambispora gerdemannii]